MIRELARTLHDRFARHELLTYASAVALQLLTAVIPLGLVLFLLMGVFGEQQVWRTDWGPTFAGHAAAPTYEAVDAVVEGLMTGHTSWLVAAILVAIWEVSGAVRCCMGALNRIFELDESRSIWHRFGLSFALAIGLALCTLGAMWLAVRGGGWVDLGAVQLLWTIARWLLVVGLLWLAISLLIRFAPNGHEPTGWVTVGGLVVIVAWIAMSLVFRWWVTSVANYRTPFGTAIALLTLVGYLYASAIVFLVGAQLDQLAIERDKG